MTRSSELPEFDPESPVSTIGSIVVAARTAELKEFSADIGIPDAVARHHKARIAAKRLRYTLELFPALLDEPHSAFLNQIRELQEVLGHLHDLDVQIGTTLHSLGITRKLAVRHGLQLLLARQHANRHTTHALLADLWQRVDFRMFDDQLTGH